VTALLTDVQARVHELYAAYTDTLDRGDLDAWLDLFIDDCRYLVTSRENDERALPLAAMRCDSRGMLADRLRALRELSVYRTRATRHLFGLPRVQARDDGRWDARAAFAVFESVSGEPAVVASTGVSRDVLVDAPGGLRIAERVCVYDAAVIDTSLVFPL
jgi:3-phenylpropionate/cinnamic acid dioxygenase small subunit